jgi:hypothetical protein
MGASPQMVDWDEDGDTDLICGESDGHVHYFQNIGTATNPSLTNRGHLQAGGIDIDTYLACPVIQDWNEDGKKDLVLGQDPASIRIYLNVGTNAQPLFNTYSEIQALPPISQIKNSPDVADLNGDGLKDLAFGWWQGTCIYYANSGTNAAPVFLNQHQLTCLGTIIDPGGTSDGWTHLETNDWDEDGDRDLLYGQWQGTVNLYLNVTDELQATLTPLNPPIVIPAQGGSFSFNGTVHNGTAWPAGGNVWTMIVDPNGQQSGPYVMGTVNVPAGTGLTRLRVQNIPGTWPSGQYQYIARWGVYPSAPWAEASFPFVKSAVATNGPAVNDWTCSGEPFPGEMEANGSVASQYAMIGVYPNPFNPTTAISYQLSANSFVNLKVYDTAGRLVATLVDGYRVAGTHEVTFDGSNLASGVYLYTLTTGGNTLTGKMVLMK